MTPPGFCPGSKGLREPTPEYVNCPQCGYEVEIWTHELMRACPQCHTPVMRPTQVSCIDWCPFAKECVGPQLYAKLKPEQEPAQDGRLQPIQALTRQHDEAIKRLGQLQGATLCLRAGARATDSSVAQTLAQSACTVEQVVQFFNAELREHFRREEEALFPLLEQRLDKKNSPVAMMLAEHQELLSKIGELKQLAASLPTEGRGLTPRAADSLHGVATEVVRLLRAHIEKENTVLFPLATAHLTPEDMSRLTALWAAAEAEAIRQ